MYMRKRTIIVVVRISPAEREMFKLAAAVAGLPVSTWLRAVALAAAKKASADRPEQSVAQSPAVAAVEKAIPITQPAPKPVALVEPKVSVDVGY